MRGAHGLAQALQTTPGVWELGVAELGFLYCEVPFDARSFFCFSTIAATSARSFFAS